MKTKKISATLAEKISQWRRTDLLNCDFPTDLTDEEQDAYCDELCHQMNQELRISRKMRSLL